MTAERFYVASSRLTARQLSISKEKRKHLSVPFTSVYNNPSEGLWVVQSHLSTHVNKGERKIIVINPRMR